MLNVFLFMFSNVIQALADEKATHIPYRNSILTRLLQESLGGNCKTGLIVSNLFSFYCVLVYRYHLRNFTMFLNVATTEILPNKENARDSKGINTFAFRK